MGSHKVRKMMKREVQNAQRRFRRQKQRNVLAKPGIHEMIIVLDHLKPSYNVGKIFRSADAFGVRRVDLVPSGAPIAAEGIPGDRTDDRVGR